MTWRAQDFQRAVTASEAFSRASQSLVAPIPVSRPVPGACDTQCGGQSARADLAGAPGLFLPDARPADICIEQVPDHVRRHYRRPDDVGDPVGVVLDDEQAREWVDDQDAQHAEDLERADRRADHAPRRCPNPRCGRPQDECPCGFCHGRPVGDAGTWVDGIERPPAPCPRCGRRAAA